MIDFSSQEECVKLLNQYASLDKHSIVIDGCPGSGKTYIARQYAKMCGFSDVVCVESKVNSIKDAFAQFMKVTNKVCLVIENLDLGVPACAYVLLKFMEEPSSNLYVVVTCQNKQNIPDTILSRSMTCSINPPTSKDLVLYANFKNKDKINSDVKSIWKCASSFNDVDEMLSFDKDKISYIKQWGNLKKFNQSVNSICWQLGHYNDGTEITSNILVRYIMISNYDNRHVVQCCKTCMDQLNSKRMARYMVLAKLAFDLKYCE